MADKNQVVDGRLVRPAIETTSAYYPGQGELKIKYGIQRDPMHPIYRLGADTPTFVAPITPMRLTLDFTYRREWLQLRALVEPGDLPKQINEVRSLDFLIRSVRDGVEKDLDEGLSSLKEFTDYLKLTFRLWLEKMEVKHFHELEHDYTYTRH